MGVGWVCIYVLVGAWGDEKGWGGCGKRLRGGESGGEYIR